MKGAGLVTNLGGESTVTPWCNTCKKAGSHQQGGVSARGNAELGTHPLGTSSWKAAVSEQYVKEDLERTGQSEKWEASASQELVRW